MNNKIKTIIILFFVLSLAIMSNAKTLQVWQNSATGINHSWVNNVGHIVAVYLNGSWNGSNNYYTKDEVNSTIDSRTATTTYYPSSFSVVTGTLISGGVTNLTSIDDINITVRETNGADAFEVRFNFTDVNDFNFGATYVWYEGSSSHEIDICLWNYVTSDWSCNWDITDNEHYELVTGSVINSENYVGTGADLGIVQLKYDHIQNGVNSHYIYIDYISISDGGSALLSNDHDSLSGRNNIILNHPNVENMFMNSTDFINTTTDGDLSMGGNLTIGNGLIYFNGSHIIIS